MAVNLQGIRRNIKNVAHNYTDAQVKVREATSNDPWGPSSTMMSEIADLTYNVSAYSEIMHMVWKRLNDHGKNWRHVYKALVLLEYLIKTGSEKVAQQCKENIFAIQTLKDFQYLDDNKDQGINVREKAKTLVALLKDDDRLKNERVRALKAKERFAQSAAGIGSDTVYNGVVRDRFDGHRGHDTVGGGGGGGGESPTHFEVPASELEAARPQTAGEEELQLQLALAMSREEHEQEETKGKSDDMRLQLALQKSKESADGAGQKGGKTSKPSNDLLDLVDINFGHPQAPAAPQQQQPPPPQRTSASALDPWGMPAPPTKPVVNDPWGGGGGQQPPAQNDPWATMQTPAASHLAAAMGDGDSSSANNDPWNAVKGSSSNNNNDDDSAQSKLVLEDSFSPPSSSVANNDPWTGHESSRSPAAAAAADPFSPVAQKELVEFDMMRGEMEQLSNSDRGRRGVSPSTSPNPFDLGELQSGLLGGGNLKNGGSPMSSAASMAQTGAKPKKSGGVQSILGEHSNLVNLDELVSSGRSQAEVRNPFEQQPPNPFQAAKAPKPAMNELLQKKNTSGWNQQQLQGGSQNQSDINPFF